MSVLSQTVVLALVGWCLLLGLALVALILQCCGRSVSRIGQPMLPLMLLTTGQTVQWSASSEWRPWLAARRGLSDEEPHFRAWSNRMGFSVLD